MPTFFGGSDVRPKVLAHIGAAVARMHGLVWVHRDIKPANIAVLDWSAKASASAKYLNADLLHLIPSLFGLTSSRFFPKPGRKHPQKTYVWNQMPSWQIDMMFLVISFHRAHIGTWPGPKRHLVRAPVSKLHVNRYLWICSFFVTVSSLSFRWSDPSLFWRPGSHRPSLVNLNCCSVKLPCSTFWEIDHDTELGWWLVS